MNICQIRSTVGLSNGVGEVELTRPELKDKYLSDGKEIKKN